MAENSKIQWCHHTFNPWRGCARVSPGCQNCYAETMSKRSPSTLGVWGPMGTRVVASESMWREPLKWDKKAKGAGERHRVFCASLADVFEDWPGPLTDRRGHVVKVNRETMEFYANTLPDGPDLATMHDVRTRLFALIDATPNLDWLLLTKRPENIAKMMPANSATVTADFVPHPRPNVWLGVSVEDQKRADERIPMLLRTPAAVRFLSCEPLLGPLNFSDVTNRSDCVQQLGKIALKGIDWLIVGGESGHGARPFDIDWAKSIVKQCKSAGVAVFVKQMGSLVRSGYSEGEQLGWKNVGHRPGGGYADWRLDDKKGGDMSEFPEELRIREFPQ